MNEETKEKKNQNFTFHDTVISWACIIWAVASVGLMMYFSGLNQVTFAIMTFGQLFLIMGIIAMNRKQATGGILTVTGVGCIIIPALNEWGHLFWNVSAPDNIFPIFATVAILLIGIAMCIVPGVLENMAERRCKKIVKAEVVDFKTATLSDGETAYAPIYSFTIGDEVYKVIRKQFSRTKVETIGTKVDLKVNEKNPEDVYFEASKASRMLIYIFGASFFVTGLGMLLTVLAEI